MSMYNSIMVESGYLEFTDGVDTNTIQLKDAVGEVIQTERSSGLITTLQGSIYNEDGENKDEFEEGWTVKLYVKYVGDGSATLRFRGKVNSKTCYNVRYRHQIISFNANSAPDQELQDNETSNDFDEEDIGQAIKDIIDDNTSGLDTSDIDTNTGVLITKAFTKTNCLQAIKELLRYIPGFEFWTDASMNCHLDELGDKASSQTITEASGFNFACRADMTKLINSVTVYGAFKDTELDSRAIDDPVQWVTVDNTRAIIDDLDIADPSNTVLSKITIYPDPTRQASGESITVRIQRRTASQTPMDATVYEYDVARGTVLAADMDSGGTVITFDLVKALPSAVTEYCIIYETNGATGQDVKRSGLPDLPAYILDKTIEISATDSDATSISTYGERKAKFINRLLDSQDKADAYAAAIIAKDPMATVSFTWLEGKTAIDAIVSVGYEATINLPDENVSSLDMYLNQRIRRYDAITCQVEDVYITMERPVTLSDAIVAQETRITRLEEAITDLANLTTGGAAGGGGGLSSRTRDIWIPASSCMAYDSNTSTIEDCMEQDEPIQPGLGLRASVHDVVMTSLSRPLDYSSTPKVTAVFATDDDHGEDLDVRLNYGSKAIADGETLPRINNFASDIGIDASETLSLTSGVLKRTDGTQQDLDTWNAGDIMFIAVQRDGDNAADTYSGHLIFIGFLVTYTAIY